MNMRTALDAKLAQLQSALGIQDAVAIAKVKNQVKDVAYHQGQEVPYNLTDSEKLEYSNESRRTATTSLLWRNIVVMCVHSFMDSHTNLAGQNEARQELGNCKCLLQATGAL